jgi:uncharacterized protein involved in high-affinity Fe2+ transport
MIFNAITFDLNLSTLISGVVLFVLGAMWAAMNKHWKKQDRARVLTDIKIESTVHAVEHSLNGQGKAFKMSYEQKKKELMRENQFVEL